MKFRVLFILFIVTSSMGFGAYGQADTISQFEWCASATSLDMIYDFSSMDKSGNVVVVGIPIKRGPTEPVIYDGKNDTIRQEPFMYYQNLIISYSPKGRVNWTFRLSKLHTEVLGVCHASRTTVLLIRVKETEKWVDNDTVVGFTEGSLPEVGIERLLPGYYLFHINSKGNQTKLQRVFESEYGDLDIHDFKANQSGYILTGILKHGTSLCSEFQLTSESGYVGFILFLSKKGTPERVLQPIFDFDGTSYNSSKFHITVTNNSIYVAGVAVTKTKEFKKRLWKPYIACYSRKGDQLWITESPNIKAECMSICANSDGAYVSYRVRNKTGKLYNDEIDSVNFYGNMVVSVSSQGAINWIKQFSSSLVKDMIINQNNEVSMLGYFDINYQVGEVVYDSLHFYERMFLATVSANGSLQDVRIIKLPTYRHDSFNVFIDKDNYKYIVGGLTNGYLNQVDTGFGDAIIYSHGPLIGKFRKSD